MRCVVSLSLPKEMCQEVERQMKKLKFDNKSEFIRYLLRYWLEQQKSQNNLVAGKEKK